MNYQGGLAYFEKLTFNRWKKLHAVFGTAEAVWQAEFFELVEAGLEEVIAHEFIAWREDVDLAQIQKELNKSGITTVSIGEPDYPRLLAEISDPPHTLFVRGKLPNQLLPTVAIVGTRKCTPYGKEVTEMFATELAEARVVTVSGLAFGIDGYAHAATLDAGGITIAVLGSGNDPETIRPASHRMLAEDIIKRGGAVVSEYPPGFEPTAYSFPARNRVIAGLSLGTLVTEAPIESGALITAKCALDYNRDVFVVPHPITSSMGEGGNRLIKQGAMPVMTTTDILEALAIDAVAMPAQTTITFPTGSPDATIMNILTRNPIHIEALAARAELPSSTVNSTLVMLELKGLVRNLGGMMYVRK